MKILRKTTLTLTLATILPCAAMAATISGTVDPGAMMGTSLQKVVTNTALTDRSVMTGNTTLSNIENSLAFGQNDTTNLFNMTGASDLQKSSWIPHNTLTQQQFWSRYCNTPNTLNDTFCPDSFSMGNANSILPLAMPLQQSVTLAKNPSDSAEGLTAAPTNTNSIDTYMKQLLNTPTASKYGVNNMTANNAPEITLASGVLRSISENYSNGNMSNLVSAAKQPFSANSAFQKKVQNANTPELLRMLVIQMAQSNYLNTQAIGQRQKMSALLAVILADQVKIRALQAAQIHQATILSKNRQLLAELLNTEQRIAEKQK